MAEKDTFQKAFSNTFQKAFSKKLMCSVSEAFISRVKYPLVFSTFLSALSFFSFKEWRIEKIKESFHSRCFRSATHPRGVLFQPKAFGMGEEEGRMGGTPRKFRTRQNYLCTSGMYISTVLKLLAFI